MHIDGYERIVFVDVGNDFSPKFRGVEHIRFVAQRKVTSALLRILVRNAGGALDFKFAIAFRIVRFAPERAVVSKAFFTALYAAVFILHYAQLTVYAVDI